MDGRRNKMKPVYRPIFTQEEIKKSKRKENLKQFAEMAKATAVVMGVIAVVGIAGAFERGLYL
jgi:hypothetical protein